MRWWLIDLDEGLRIYDFEELSVGLRTMTLMGLILKQGIKEMSET
ncbi:MAG: hypothetical protein ACN4GF_01050 [Lentimonas sp.]